MVGLCDAAADHTVSVMRCFNDLIGISFLNEQAKFEMTCPNCVVQLIGNASESTVTSARD